MSEIDFSKIVRLRFYEPKLVPELDDSGNVIKMVNPPATVLSLSDSDGIRQKPWPNQKGMTTNPNNPTGFRALIDLINQNRNLSGAGYVPLGADDAGSYVAFNDAVELSKKQES